MGNGMNKILPGLYIGNFKDARDAEQLSRNKVTHILSVHDSARPMLEGVKYLCIPAADSPSQNLTRHFKESIKFIHECRLRGEGCLVHCITNLCGSQQPASGAMLGDRVQAEYLPLCLECSTMLASSSSPCCSGAFWKHTVVPPGVPLLKWEAALVVEGVQCTVSTGVIRENCHLF
ncbi:dual specificity protein phosphatase 22 isoform X5 [Eptesicus fuscus]|uniref:dual specificity protein phosphatase 22 isoform X5 n=1 Tax=Eptesicus fuscus TaxID=29078 RepID=UPI0024048B6E|nr:dual specificity protein phosphatase 22 isoform X5 [Eptesicus fuscus]